MKKILTKLDVILIAVVLLAVAALAWYIKPSGSGGGMQVQITLDGEVYGTYNLTEDREIDIRQASGDNRLLIRSGEIWMEEADCPDQYCIRQGKIHVEKQTIVCLPHKLVATVLPAAGAGNESDIPDATAQ